MMQETNVYEGSEYKRSRTAYMMQCAFEYFVAIVVGGSFLTKLLGYVGFSDGAIGIISSLISLTCVFQLLSMLVVQKISNTKKYSMTLQAVGRLLFMSLYLIPFLPFAKEYRGALIVAGIVLAYLCYYLATSVTFKWGNSFVDPRKRAEFSAVKEMISLIMGMVVTLVVGYVMDVFEASNNLEGGFIFCAAAILIFAICDLTCLLLIKNDIKPKAKQEKEPMKVVLQNTIGKRGFRNIIILSTLYNIAVYFSVGFLSTYRLNAHELAFSVATVELFNVIGSGVRFLISKPFGRYSDRKSFAKGIELGMILAAASFVLSVFTMPETRYLAVVQILLYHMASAGVGQNMLNITYNFVDMKYFVQASAIKNALGGLCGFGASLLGSALLTAMQTGGNQLLGIRIYGQQLLSLVTAVLIAVCILYNRKVAQKEKIKVQ